MILLFIFLLYLFLFPQYISATYNPTSVPNNTYGIHIVDTNEIADTAPLLNSSGGEWGYVTMVLSDADRDHGRWQNIFNEMRRLHLIPIIRLATHVEHGVWVKPTKDRLYEIVNLLNGMNWPTENRYVVLFNEPNHADEWGGAVNPEEYADDAVTLAKQFKAANPDFFILPAGLDASSADDGESMDEAAFLQRAVAAQPEYLTVFDGWTSHSYPNPGFSGSPYATGRGTLTTYTWELSYLTNLGLTKQLPVFITETGWEHREGVSLSPGLLSADQVAANLQVAAQNVWSDPRIAAVTPFIFNYQDVPFDHFSWKEIGGNDFYRPYYAYQALPKISGAPKQHESYTLARDLLPKTMVAGSSYTFSAPITNTGQGIVDPTDGYVLSVETGDSNMSVVSDPLPYVEPNEKGIITVHIQTASNSGSFPVSVVITHSNDRFILEKRDILLVPPPSLTVHAQLGWRKTNTASGVTVLLYDNRTLLQKFSGLTMENGTVPASGLTGIIPGNSYRVVTLVPGYLPRQTIQALGSQVTNLYPKRFLPLDFNNDGAFTFADILSLLHLSPWTAITRFFGP